MSVSRILVSGRSIIILAICFLFIISAACQQGRRIELGGDEERMLGDEAIVIARVGDTEITLHDLLQLPNVHMYLNDHLIMTEVVRQEAAQRGIVPSREEVEERVNAMVEQRGGVDEFLRSIPPPIPKSLVLEDLTRQFTIGYLQEKILEDVFENEQGPPSDEEMQGFWDDNSSWLQSNLSAEQGLDDPESVTMEMCREKIIDALKQRWMGEVGQNYFRELTEEYDVENFLKERFEEYQEPVEVPPVTEEGVEHEESSEPESEETAEHEHG